MKDHKKKDDKDRYPLRLVVSAANFTAGFPHAGQRGIQKILGKNKIEYSQKTIVQASHLKEDINKLPINRQKTTIMSINPQKKIPISEIHPNWTRSQFFPPKKNLKKTKRRLKDVQNW